MAKPFGTLRSALLAKVAELATRATKQATWLAGELEGWLGVLAPPRLGEIDASVMATAAKPTDPALAMLPFPAHARPLTPRSRVWRPVRPFPGPLAGLPAALFPGLPFFWPLFLDRFFDLDHFFDLLWEPWLSSGDSLVSLQYLLRRTEPRRSRGPTGLPFRGHLP